MCKTGCIVRIFWPHLVWASFALYVLSFALALYFTQLKHDDIPATSYLKLCSTAKDPFPVATLLLSLLIESTYRSQSYCIDVIMLNFGQET